MLSPFLPTRNHEEPVLLVAGEGIEPPTRGFEGRIIGVDGAIADEWGRVIARGEARGRPMSAIDALIAATTQVHDLTVVTRNAADFQSSMRNVLNPGHDRRTVRATNFDDTPAHRADVYLGESVKRAIGKTRSERVICPRRRGPTMKPRHLDKMRSRRSDAAARRLKLRPAPEASLTRAICVWSWKKRSTGLVQHFAKVRNRRIARHFEHNGRGMCVRISLHLG